MEQKHLKVLRVIVADLPRTVDVNTEYVQLTDAITCQKNVAHMKPKHKL